MSEQWMSIVEYARRFSISDMTVRRRIKTGKLHAVLRDGKYYIPLRETDEKPVSKPQLSASMASSEAALNYSASPRPPLPVPPTNRMAMANEGGYPEKPVRLDTASNSFDRKVIPETIPSSFHSPSQSLVDSQALLRYCESSLERFTAMEKQLKDSYNIKIQALEDRLKAKDLEIARLRQQVEDLQTLINMIDHPSKPK